MPSRGFAAAQAVTRTMVSPERTTTAPSACLASRPVSNGQRLSPDSDVACMHVSSFTEEEVPAAPPGMSGMNRAGDSDAPAWGC